MATPGGSKAPYLIRYHSRRHTLQADCTHIRGVGWLVECARYVPPRGSPRHATGIWRVVRHHEVRSRREAEALARAYIAEGDAA